MKLTTILRLVLLCGASLATSEVLAATYYVSPKGSGTTCSEKSPCALNRIAVAARPGDTWILKDGQYQHLHINCASGGTGAANGTQSYAITVRAQNERRAWLKGTGGNVERVKLTKCSWWVIEGLRLSDADNSATSSNRHIVDLLDSHNNVLRRLLLHHPNRYNNSHLLRLYQSHNNLVEESELYNFHRHGVIPNSGNNNTIRRVYCNARSHGNIEGGYNSGSKTGGDSCISIYPGSFNIVENVFVEGNSGQLSEINGAATNIGNKFFGVIVRDVSINSWSIGVNPNSRAYVVKDMTCENCLIMQLPRGIRATSTSGIRCDNCTIIAAHDAGVDLRHVDGRGDGNNSFFATNLLIVGPGGTGVRRVEGTWTVGINYINTFNVTKPLSNLPDGSVSNHKSLDPNLGGCPAFIRSESPMKGIGLKGKDIGANILYAYENGSPTNKPLWDANTKEIRAEFRGETVNDAVLNTTKNSIHDFGSRLHPNCGSWPAGYGGTGTGSRLAEPTQLRAIPE